jgi:hypothetical protein
MGLISLEKQVLCVCVFPKFVNFARLSKYLLVFFSCDFVVYYVIETRTFRHTKCRHKKKNVSNIVSEINDYTELDTALILIEEQSVKVGF